METQDEDIVQTTNRNGNENCSGMQNQGSGVQSRGCGFESCYPRQYKNESRKDMDMERRNFKVGDVIYDPKRDKFGQVTKFYTGADGSAFLAYKENKIDEHPYVARWADITLIDLRETYNYKKFGIPPLQIGEEVKLVFTDRIGKVIDFFYNIKDNYVVEVQFGEVSLFLPEEMLERDIERWKMMN